LSLRLNDSPHLHHVAANYAANKKTVFIRSFFICFVAAPFPQKASGFSGPQGFNVLRGVFVDLKRIEPYKVFLKTNGDIISKIKI